MAKKLNPKEIEAARKRASRKERRQLEKKLLHEEIARNQNGKGVVVIPPRRKAADADTPRVKLRVAAYCRVSTQEEQQMGSFEMQVRHFQQRIGGTPDWQMVEIYKDEGISGTTVHKRLGFQRMIADAEAGKIDRILTKSINRFGRNIVDIMNNLRKLSQMPNPVTVEFETEGIVYSGDGQNNFLIAILSALVELESKQKSEAVKAGIRWRMADGIYKFSVHNTLGYYRDHFGRIVIEPAEAQIVQYIYARCLEGAAPSEIAKALTDQGIKSPLGKDVWSADTVRSILRNEKYCGDALMQKTYVVDFRTHRSVKNTDLNMYFKENHHAAIIQKKDWNKAQEQLAIHRHVGRAVQLQRLKIPFLPQRVKSGMMKGYILLDSRWNVVDRRALAKLIDNVLNRNEKE